MKKELKTIKDATYEWVRGFNAIPMHLFERAFGGDRIDDITEITKPTPGDRVDIYSDELQGMGTVNEIDNENKKAIVTMDDGETGEVSLNDMTLEHDDFFPMWGTLWTFEEGSDEMWCRENLYTASSCGFRIYEDNVNGDIYIGIDGAGYNFYDAHWIPLYKARGLQWHDIEDKE